MTRRSLLRALGATAGLCLGLPLGAGAWEPSASALAGRLREMSRAPRSAAAIGRAYLSEHPEERSLAFLSRELARVLPHARDDTLLRAALRARIRGEFAREEVVQVGGWMLARTEARVAALAAL